MKKAILLKVKNKKYVKNALQSEKPEKEYEVENGELTKMIFMPIEEMFGLPRSRHGWPLKNTSSNIIERFAEMSKPYGVDIKIENGLGVVKL